MKLKLLDLFSGAGGAGMGYHRAGFEVVGVDIAKQKNYPFEFHQADALEFLAAHGSEFDAIHASPPCQVHSVLSHLARPSHKDLIPQTRDLLKKTKRPFIIENVPKAPLLNPIMLCGSMFGLRTKCGASLRRHRIFEISGFSLFTLTSCKHTRKTISIFGDKARNTAVEKRHYTKNKINRGPPPDDILFTLEAAQTAMGCNWMSFKELSQAIPPAFTEYLGRQLIKRLNAGEE